MSKEPAVNWPIAIALLLIGIAADVCWADTITCNFGNCAVISSDGVRRMSPKETRDHLAEEEIRRLGQIDCALSASESRCRDLKRALFELFR